MAHRRHPRHPHRRKGRHHSLWAVRGVKLAKRRAMVCQLGGRLLCTGAGQGSHTGIIIPGGPPIATDPGDGCFCCMTARPPPQGTLCSRSGVVQELLNRTDFAGKTQTREDTAAATMQAANNEQVACPEHRVARTGTLNLIRTPHASIPSPPLMKSASHVQSLEG